MFFLDEYGYSSKSIYSVDISLIGMNIVIVRQTTKFAASRQSSKRKKDLTLYANIKPIPFSNHVFSLDPQAVLSFIRMSMMLEIGKQ